MHCVNFCWGGTVWTLYWIFFNYLHFSFLLWISLKGNTCIYSSLITDRYPRMTACNPFSSNYNLFRLTKNTLFYWLQGSWQINNRYQSERVSETQWAYGRVRDEGNVMTLLCDNVRIALDSCDMTHLVHNSSATGGGVNTWAA